MNEMKLDALALEYQGYYGTARGNYDVFDLLNNSFVQGEGGILSLSFPKELLYFPVSEFSVASNNISDSGLVA